jgi:predicted HicB family RNase H-like nuclease
MTDNEKFVVTKKHKIKDDKSVTMSIRIDRILQRRLDDLARQSNRSRNELINLALEFAVENIEIQPGPDEDEQK